MKKGTDEWWAAKLSEILAQPTIKFYHTEAGWARGQNDHLMTLELQNGQKRRLVLKAPALNIEEEIHLLRPRLPDRLERRVRLVSKKLEKGIRSRARAEKVLRHQHSAERPLPKIEPTLSRNMCSYCLKSVPEIELTLDDSIVAKWICESCYRKVRKGG